MPEMQDKCWLYHNPNSNGYGQHRRAWEILVGPIPAGHDLDHECHNRDRTCAGGKTCAHRACYNPRHLRVRKRRDNLMRGLTYSPEVNALRGAKASDYLNQPEVKKTFRAQGREDAIRGWMLEDRSPKFCAVCGGGPYKGARAATIHARQKGCDV